MNSSVTGDQLLQRVAPLEDGGFLVLWESRGGGGEPSVVLGRRFGSDGQPGGTEFPVTSTVTSDQRAPDIALGVDGSLLATWSMDEPPFVVGQRLDVGGSPVGSEIAIPDSAFPYGAGAQVAPLQSGEFVVVWTDSTGPGTYRVRGRKVGADGSLSEPSFTVTEIDSIRRQYRAAVAGHSDGRFLVVWFEQAGDLSFEAAVRARPFTASTPLRPEFTVGIANDYNLGGPETCALSDSGGFVVTWATYEGPSSESDHPVRYRLYAGDGTPLTAALRATPEVADAEQGAPAVACGPGDAFVLMWREREPALKGRVFQGGGTADFSIGIAPGPLRFKGEYPALAWLRGGDFVATWATCTAETGCDVFGQMFTLSASDTCAGDCDGDGAVRVDELLTGVRAALSEHPDDTRRCLASLFLSRLRRLPDSEHPDDTRRCLALDLDLNYLVTVNELVRAVTVALKGCPS